MTRKKVGQKDVREALASEELRGGMGVSSEWVGYAGPRDPAAAYGTRTTAPPPLPDDPPPEQEPGNPESNPIGIPPKPHDPARNPGHSHG